MSSELIVKNDRCSVHKVEDGEKAYAIKRMEFDVGGSVREVNVVTQLNIASCPLPVEWDDFHVKIMMPLFSRPSFTTRHHMMPFTDWMDMVRTVLRKLNWMWRQGFTHGDVKADNIMLTEEGPSYMLIDYGASMPIDICGFARGRSIEKYPPMYRGTIIINSPGETLGILDHNTPAADAFALGATLAYDFVNFVGLHKQEGIKDVYPATFEGELRLIINQHGCPPRTSHFRREVEWRCPHAPHIFFSVEGKPSPLRAALTNVFEEATTEGWSWSGEEKASMLEIFDHLTSWDPEERMQMVHSLIGDTFIHPMDGWFPGDREPCDHSGMLTTNPDSILADNMFRKRLIIAMAHFTKVSEDDVFVGMDMLIAALCIMQRFVILMEARMDTLFTEEQIMNAGAGSFYLAMEILQPPRMNIMKELFINSSSLTNLMSRETVQDDFASMLLPTGGLHHAMWISKELNGAVLIGRRLPRLGKAFHQCIAETWDYFKSAGLPGFLYLVDTTEGWDKAFNNPGECRRKYEEGLEL